MTWTGEGYFQVELCLHCSIKIENSAVRWFHVVKYLGIQVSVVLFLKAMLPNKSYSG